LSSDSLVPIPLALLSSAAFAAFPFRPFAALSLPVSTTFRVVVLFFMIPAPLPTAIVLRLLLRFYSDLPNALGATFATLGTFGSLWLSSDSLVPIPLALLSTAALAAFAAALRPLAALPLPISTTFRIVVLFVTIPAPLPTCVHVAIVLQLAENLFHFLIHLVEDVEVHKMCLEHGFCILHIVPRPLQAQLLPVRVQACVHQVRAILEALDGLTSSAKDPAPHPRLDREHLLYVLHVSPCLLDVVRGVPEDSHGQLLFVTQMPRY